MTNLALNVAGMSCGHCVNSIESALKEVGVEGKVNLADGIVAVAFDENKVTIATIKETIENQGYDVK
ncbi:cation transporter [Paenibacillus sp. GCM10012307]|uniref:Heavy-metal-associated domain-containing protein n=1 Tax=Paenibacillus roseus TaxID=2798579 RepID=A0A934MR65_9BACL|nr:cation transporter [Paenibacillus roseus]MBJ6362588.1 heavy-metal-associated domain-containing protein [Paenibacillus roseus]